MKPRKRPFKQDNKLKLAFIKDSRELGNDFIGIVPKDENNRCDLYFLFYQFLKRPIENDTWDKEKKCWTKHPSFIEELKSRGYDATTIYFEIEKSNVETKE